MNFEALIAAFHPTRSGVDNPLLLHSSEHGQEIQRASFGVMECLEELTPLGLVQYLPLSV